MVLETSMKRKHYYAKILGIMDFYKEICGTGKSYVEIKSVMESIERNSSTTKRITTYLRTSMTTTTTRLRNLTLISIEGG